MKTVIAELVDDCYLQCALCWNRGASGRQMSLTTIAKILKKYDSDEISWFNWGEPLLHKEFEAFARMAGRSNAKNIMSSSMSLPVSDERLRSLRNFDDVCVSVSGMTPDVYNIYHTNGNFDLVMKNLRRLAQLKLKNVKFKWLTHKHNVFQLSEARRFAEGLGFKFAPIELNCCVEDLMGGFDHELLRFPKFPRKQHFCHLRYWDVIDVDGNHLLCCASHNVKIGYSVDDKVSNRELRGAKSKTALCETCSKNEYWRMF